MSTSLSRVECKKHLLLFSASTPVGAITSYVAFSLFGSKQVDGVGTALLISVSSREIVATSISNTCDSRAEVFSMLQQCCNQSPMIVRRPKELVLRCEFCSSCWEFSRPLLWGVYWIMDMIMARLPSRHDSMFRNMTYYKVSQRRYKPSAKAVAPVVTNIIDKL